VDALNLYLFHAIAAGCDPHPLLLPFALHISQRSGWACLLLLAGAVWYRPKEITLVLGALVIGGAVSLIARDLAASLDVARPFMVGLSPQHAAHGARAGLPSTHASVMFAIAFVVLLRRPLRNVGQALMAAAVLTAWSRVYLGLHFPADVVAGMMLGIVAASGAFIVNKVFGVVKNRQQS
jgi:membrane-associated phospholipid phosphatase